jgi:hypothetical protein
MRYEKFAVAVVSAVIIIVMGSTAKVAGQASKPASKIPRTLDGKPDFQGLWSHATIIPLERPEGVTKLELTDKEAAELEKQTQQNKIDLRIENTVTPPGQKTTDAYNTFWRDGYWGVPAGSRRTSQIVDPPDGHLPPLTPEARQRQKESSERTNRSPRGPEDRPIWTRCVRGQVSGPPLVGSGGRSYNQNIQIIQNPNTLVVLQEMVHETQIVALDGRPRPSQPVGLYKGSSRGHWEGDTLVIDSTNFRFEGVASIGGGAGTTKKLHVVERYKLLDAENLVYGFTVEDPGTWTKPWSAEFMMKRLPKDQQVLPEYACHEGNRSLEYALSGARALEREGRVSGQPLGGDEEQ